MPTYKDINLLTKKTTIAGTEKIPVSDTEFVSANQIASLGCGQELMGGTYHPASANTSAACAFVNGKKYTIRITWSYTSGYCAYVAVRKYNESLVRVSSYYYNASGSDTFEYTADDDYTAIYVVSGGTTIDGTIELSVTEAIPRSIENYINDTVGNIESLLAEI